MHWTSTASTTSADATAHVHETHAVKRKQDQEKIYLEHSIDYIHPASFGVAAHTASFYKVQVATTTTPRNTLQTTFCPNSPPRILPSGVFFSFPPGGGFPS